MSTRASVDVPYVTPPVTTNALKSSGLLASTPTKAVALQGGSC